MAVKSALFAGLLTLIMVLALGNGWVWDQVGDSEGSSAFTQQTVVGMTHYGDEVAGDRGATIGRLAILVLLSALLGGIAGRARPLAAFVGGWGAFLGASVVSAGIYAFLSENTGSFLMAGGEGVDKFTTSALVGAPLGIWLGWLVGLAVMLGSFGSASSDRPTPRPASTFPPPGPDGGAPDSAGPAEPYGSPSGPPPPPTGAADPYGSPPAPPPATPPPADAPTSIGGPVIGTPPDRTQIYGQPPAGHPPREG